jgi:hypothetical protein
MAHELVAEMVQSLIAARYNTELDAFSYAASIDHDEDALLEFMAWLRKNSYVKAVDPYVDGKVLFHDEFARISEALMAAYSLRPELMRRVAAINQTLSRQSLEVLMLQNLK